MRAHRELVRSGVRERRSTRTIYEDVDRLTVRHGYAFLAAAAVCPGRHVGRSGALAAVRIGSAH